tara:strand:+ start:4674 stop:4901 length:228 start_codon:yes stop_codon:yes gene_type:complete
MSNLNLKKKDDVFIKLTKCLDKCNSVRNLSNWEDKALNDGWIMALKWVLGYDELNNSEELYLDNLDDNEIDMNKL